MKTSGYFISSTAKFTSCMKDRKYNFNAGYTFFLIDPNRNSTPIILNRYRAVFVQCYDDRITESSQRFIYGIIYNFVYQMMKSMQT